MSSQTRALQNINSYALQAKAQAQKSIDEILRMTSFDHSRSVKVQSSLRSGARVCLHFHPDRPARSALVAECLLEEGIYRNQFETGISAGSVSAYAGGERDNWERAVFRGAYHRLGVKPADRPKYGALNLISSSDGPSPRFGSCFFVLKPTVTQRCTFTYRDSHQNPKEKGTIENFEYVFSALLSDVFFNGQALGHSLTIPRLFDHLERHTEPWGAAAEAP